MVEKKVNKANAILLDKIYGIWIEWVPLGELSIVRRWWRRRRCCDHAKVSSEATEPRSAGKLQVKTAKAESGDEKGAKGEKKKKSEEKKNATDFHQDRLSNQMGTIQELGHSGWGGTLIGQISAQTRHQHQSKMGFLSTLLLHWHVTLNVLK